MHFVHWHDLQEVKCFLLVYLSPDIESRHKILFGVFFPCIVIREHELEADILSMVDWSFALISTVDTFVCLFDSPR